MLSWFVVIFGLHPTQGSSAVFFSEEQIVFLSQMTIKSSRKRKKDSQEWIRGFLRVKLNNKKTLGQKFTKTIIFRKYSTFISKTNIADELFTYLFLKIYTFKYNKRYN